MQRTSFPVYDADTHLYEPEEAFARHLPARFKRDFYFVDVEGRRKLVIGGMLSEYIPNPTFAVVAAPGSHVKWYRAENPEGQTLRELSGKPIRPPETWRTGEGRIALLDEQGVHAALVFGSDYPALSMERTLSEAASLDLPDEVRHGWLYQNGKSFFLDRLGA